MASLDHRVKPLYAIKKCWTCGTLYTKYCSCSNGSLGDKILVPVPDSSQQPLKIENFCFDCGDLVRGPNCQRCALIRKTFEEAFQDFRDTFESSDDNDNVVNAPREPFVVKNNPDVNSSQSPSHIDDHCCYKCGDSLDGIFCQRCTCEFCGKGAHIGYNCPSKAPIISNPEPTNQTVDELPQAPQSLQQQKLFAIQKKEEEKRIAKEQAAKDRYWKIPICNDNDEDYTIAITPVLSTEEPVNSLSMGDEHLYTILATESDEVIKSSVEILVPTPSESEGVPKVCDLPFHDNSSPRNNLKDQFEDLSDSNDVSTSSDEDSFSIDDIEYVEASPPDYEPVSSEVMEIVIPEIEALKDNPTPSSDFMTKSSSTFPNLFLEETSTFDNALPEYETFRFNLEEISSGSPTTHSDLSLSDYKAFYIDNDHFKEKSSGSTTTHVDFSQYDSFIFDLSNDQFPPADRSDFLNEEFTDELAHIISQPEYDCFFKNKPEMGNFTMDEAGNIFPTNVLNVLPTHPTLDLDSILFSEPMFAYVVWIFLPFLFIPVVPQYLLSTGNKDTIFDPGISIYHSFMPDVSHQSGTFMKFNTYRSHLNESRMMILSSTCFPMHQ
ncbi:hypothetical protein Tco_0432293 [Tanacetum coccineum]